MKKFLLLAIASTCLSFVSHAQINKGSLLLGGLISASHGSSEQGTQTSKNNSVIVTPSVGVAIKTNLIAGVGFTYGHQKSKASNNSSEYSSNLAGGNIYVRKYSPLGKGFYLFGQVNGGYFQNTEKQISGTDYSGTLRSSNIYASLNPGIAYAVNKRFHLEVGIPSLVNLGYSTTKIENRSFGNVSTSKADNFGFSTNVGGSNPLSVGFRIVLGK